MCQKHCQAGVEFDIEPEAEPIEMTFYDCWSPSGDETTEPAELGSIQALPFAKLVLSHWAANLSLPSIHPSRIAPEGFSDAYLDNHDALFSRVIKQLLKAGYCVYESDTRIGIYLMEDVQDEIDENPEMVREVKRPCCGHCQSQAAMAS